MEPPKSGRLIFIGKIVIMLRIAYIKKDRDTELREMMRIFRENHKEKLKKRKLKEKSNQSKEP